MEINEPFNKEKNGQIVNSEPVDIYLSEPKSIRNSWLKAIEIEYMNLIDNNTFNLKENPLEGDQIIPTSMIYKAKSTSSGTLEKLKARCCARGDLIKDPQDQDNWSNCASQRTVREFIPTEKSLKRKK